MATLIDYWTDDKARRDATVSALDAALVATRSALDAQRAARLAAGQVEADRAVEIANLRRQLAAIALPADAAPLLAAMNTAIKARAKARVDRANTDLAAQTLDARRGRLDAQRQGAPAAQAGLATATARAEARQVLADRFASGDLSTLAADATQARSDFEADARKRVEEAFPSNADAVKDFLARVRDRRDLVAAAGQAASATAAYAAALVDSVATQKRAAYDAAWDALVAASLGAARLATARAGLEALASPSAPALLSAEDAAALKEATQQADREDALIRLGTADLAERERIAKQAAYDQALADLRKIDPDTPQVTLDADPAKLMTQADELTDATGVLATARGNVTAADHSLLDDWFAAVPDTLWDALEALDAAVATLAAIESLVPTSLIDDLDSKEDQLVKALQAADLAARAADAVADAGAEAAGRLAAEADTATRRARALSRSAVVC